MPQEYKNPGRILNARIHLKAGLTPYVEQRMQAVYGDGWRGKARGSLSGSYARETDWDDRALLVIMTNLWNDVFRNQLGHEGRRLASELREQLNRSAHQTFDYEADTHRLLDTMARLLQMVGAEEEAAEIKKEAKVVIRSQLLKETPEEEEPDGGNGDADRENTAGPEAPPTDLEADPTEEAEETTSDEPGEQVTAEPKKKARRFFIKIKSPLELRTKILDEVERALRPYKSHRPLPFHRLTVHILAPDDEERQLYRSAIDDLDPDFRQAVHGRLQEAGFTIPPGLSVQTKLNTQVPKKLEQAFEKGPIYIELKRKAQRSITATITVIEGKAEEKTYRLRSKPAYNIGRMRKVPDENNVRIIRENDIVFLDPRKLRGKNKDINQTVSRRHARIEYDEREGTFIFHNEEGRTEIRRAGYSEPVRVRGQLVQLQDKDLIYLGKACLEFEIKRR